MTTDPWTCTACTAQSSPAAQFCTSCGARRPEEAPRCSACGEHVSSSAFCVHCGTAVAAPAPSPPAAPAARESPAPPAPPAPPVVPVAPVPAPETDTAVPSGPRPRRRRARTWVLGVLVLVVVGGVAVASVLLSRESDVAASEIVEPEPAAASDVPEPSVVATTVPPEAVASVEPSDVPAPAVTCWDGGTAPLLADCQEPRGREGLFWMFPSMVDQAASCADIADPRKDGKLLVRHCEIPTDDGVVEINYSWWRQVDRMHRYYATEFDVIDSAVEGDLQTYRYDERREQWKGALHYVDLPFSATVYASTSQALKRYLSEKPIVVARPAREYRGVSS